MNCISNAVCFYFESEEQRQKMIEKTKLVCIYEGSVVRYDPSDESFWSFGSTSKVKVPISEVRKMPEVVLLKINLAKIMKN